MEEFSINIGNSYSLSCLSFEESRENHEKKKNRKKK